MHTTVRHIATGDKINPRQLTTIQREQVSLPSPDGLTHLQFRRFAGCPICNVHLHKLAQRHQELVAANIHEIAVFHSSEAAMRPHQGALPFAAVADPGRELYAEFGVEQSPKAVLHPSAFTTPLRPAAWAAVARGLRAGGRPSPQGDGALGLPAEFLITPNGQVIAAHYGRHANDQWSVDEVLSRAG